MTASPYDERAPAIIAGLLLVACYAIALVQGFRMPNLWSVNYFLPSIVEGFYRRSLLGTILLPFGDHRFNYYFIATIQIGVFVALNVIILRALLRADWRLQLAYCLFLLGPAGGYLFHEIGYVDQVLFLILIAALTTENRLLGTVLIGSALFVHEMALFTIVPLYAACRLYDGDDLGRVAASSAFSAALFVLIYSFFQLADAESVARFLEVAKHEANYVVREDYYQVFQQSFAGDRQRVYYGSDETIELFLVGLLSLYVGVLLAGGVSSVRDKAIRFISAATAGFSPILLGLFAWDVHRWIFLSVAGSFFCVYWARKSLDSLKLCALAAILLLFDSTTSLKYFDYYEPREINETNLYHFLGYEFVDELTAIPKQ